MNLTERQDVAAPAPWVFDQLADFESFERMAAGRGVVLRRVGLPRAPGPGMAWTAEYEMRGKPRRTEIELTRFEPPRTMILATRTGGVTGDVSVTVEALSPSASRIALSVDFAATSLTAKLLLQSLKLAKGQVAARLGARLGRFGKDLEARYAATA